MNNRTNGHLGRVPINHGLLMRLMKILERRAYLSSNAPDVILGNLPPVCAHNLYRCAQRPQARFHDDVYCVGLRCYHCVVGPDHVVMIKIHEGACFVR